MKNYYLMVHFDACWVTGFLAFGVNDEEEARRKVIKSLLEKKSKILKEDQWNKRKRVSRFIKALNHPWRITEYGKSVFGHWSNPTIEYLEITDQTIEAGYWLEEISSGENYCNLIHR